jgi:chromate transporter
MDPVPFSEAVRTWARVAALSFGGPAGQIAVMHRILVEEKRWIGETRFLHALNYCMLLPGPEAHQLAVYIGWLLHGTRGGLVAGTLFILPGLLVLGILSWIYATFGNVGIVSALFFGLKAAVLALVVEAVMRVGKRALKTQAHYSIAAAAFVAIFFFAAPFPAIIAAAALIGLLGDWAGLPSFRASPHAAGKTDDGSPAAIDVMFARGVPEHAERSGGRFVVTLMTGLALWLGPLAILFILLGPGNVYTAIAAFNSKMAVVTFGGAYAVLAYMAQQAVEHYGWLGPDEMLIGLGFAETTPGPLICVVQFVGFMAAFRAELASAGGLDPSLAGTLGGLLAMWATFVPSFLWIFLGGPYVEALIGNARLNAALSAITAAVVGVILNLAAWFALHVLFGEVNDVEAYGLTLHAPALSSVDWPALVLALIAGAATFVFRLGMMWTLALCSALGVAWHFAAPMF